MSDYQSTITVVSTMIVLFVALWQLQHRETKALKTQLVGRLDNVDARFDRVDARLDGIDARIDRVVARIDSSRNELSRELGARIDKVDQKIDTVRTELGERIDKVDQKIDTVRTELGERIDTLRIDLTRELGGQIKELDGRVYHLALTVGGLRNDLAARDPDQERVPQPA